MNPGLDPGRVASDDDRAALLSMPPGADLSAHHHVAAASAAPVSEPRFLSSTHDGLDVRFSSADQAPAVMWDLRPSTGPTPRARLPSNC